MNRTLGMLIETPEKEAVSKEAGSLGMGHEPKDNGVYVWVFSDSMAEGTFREFCRHLRTIATLAERRRQREKVIMS